MQHQTSVGGLDDVAGQRCAVNQCNSVGTGGDEQPAKPETEYWPKNSAHMLVLANQDAARKKIQMPIFGRFLETRRPNQKSSSKCISYHHIRMR
jgi:hypothetical protein